MQPSRSPSPSLSTMADSAMTFDEVSMQRSRDFVMALQELKNLRPQLYSAAEYCESSYLYSEQKQAVLDNLKDYSVKALVNAVDHLGTVAYKLNDLLTQQTTEISSAEIRVASLVQRMKSCQDYTDRQGLRQQSLTKSYPRHHKHYIFPDPDVVTQPPKTHSSPMSGSTQKNVSKKCAGEVSKRVEIVPESVVESSSGSLSWHMSSDNHQSNKSNGDGIGTSPSARDAFFKESFGALPAKMSPSLSMPTPGRSPLHAKVMEEARSLSSLMSNEVDQQQQQQQQQQRVFKSSKNMLMSLLGKKNRTLKHTRSNV